MKKLIFPVAIAVTLLAAGCHKTSNNNSTAAVSEQAVVTDFVNKIAVPQYQDLQAKATTLNTAVNTLNTTPTEDNLLAARQAWQATRGAWEACEGFLIGPVEDDNYDPNMDTWPVDYGQLDSFINSPGAINTATVAALEQSLRGFHPLEYILWGQHGDATVSAINAKDKQYMVALSQDILNTVTQLNSSWSATGGNFQAQLLNTSTRYPNRQSVFLEMVDGMAGICEEVGGGKIKDPFDSKDSTKTESPFSHNSVTDFTNNIKGAQNVYLCSYAGQTGTSLSNFVSSKNLSLDNTIKQQYAAAIAAMSNITVSFETAIITQRPQLQTAMDAINTLHTTLDGQLKPFIVQYVKD